MSPQSPSRPRLPDPGRPVPRDSVARVIASVSAAVAGGPGRAGAWTMSWVRHLLLPIGCAAALGALAGILAPVGAAATDSAAAALLSGDPLAYLGF